MRLFRQFLTAYCVDVDPLAPCTYEWLSKPFGRTVRTHHAMWANHTEIRCQKLSEKGFEQRSEGGFGRYIGAETGRIVPLRCPGRPRLTHLRDFSDKF
jgi:hypothetical protein